jgi:hypothetical protein
MGVLRSGAPEHFEIRPYDNDEINRLAGLGFTSETDPVVLVDGPHLELCFQLVDTRDRNTRRHLHFDIDTKTSTLKFNDSST